MARVMLASASWMALSAASSSDMPKRSAMGAKARRDSSASIFIRPPRNASGRIVWQITCASVSVGSVPPRM